MGGLRNTVCVWQLCCLFIFLPFVVTGITTGPSSVFVKETDTVILTCSAGFGVTVAYASWADGAETIANGGVVFNTDIKYTNFDVIYNVATGQNDLRINNTQYDDEGVYRCQINSESDDTPTTVTVEAEVTSVTISVDGTTITPSATVTMTENTEYELVCTALRARPRVAIEWYKSIGGDEVEIPGDVETDRTNAGNPNTEDTISTLHFTPSKDNEDHQLICRTSGQQAAQSQSQNIRLNVQYLPVVSVIYSGGEITCSSDANPLATDHKIILNGTTVLKEFTNSPVSEKFTAVDGCTIISCNATNTVGTGTATFSEAICPGYVEPTATPATKSMPPTKPPSAGQGLDTGAIIGIAVGVLVVVCIVIIAIIICYKKKIFCFDNNKTSNSTSPKKQPSAKNADMIRNQPEVRQSVHNYDDEPKKPRVPRSNSGKPAAAAAAVPPEKEALRQNPPPHSKDRDHQNYPMDSRDGGPEHGGQAGINYADLEFQNRQGATNGHGRVHPREDEPTQYASILV